MSIKHPLSIFITFICYHLSGASTDSLIMIKDLSFKNPVERTAFIKFSKKDTADVINLFLTPFDKDNGYDATLANQKINDCITYLQKELTGKTDVKKARIVYDYVHKTFLKVYKLRNSFSDIFERGEYNCVSASALYAIVFSKLGIPYQVKELPEHVYVMAYPQTAKILIETTSPDKGYYHFSDDFQKKYVKTLFESKSITKQEFDTTSTDLLFNKYYFSSESVSLIRLAGLQYSNYGVYDLDDKNYEKAISELKDAYYLNPSERQKFILKSTLIYQVGSNNYNDRKQIYNLELLCRCNNLKDHEVSNETIKSEFGRIIQAQLINNSDYERFDSAHTIISGTLTDTILRNDIDFNYHSELARLGYINLKNQEYEMGHLKAAYRINPRNANLQAIILGYFERLIQKNDNAKSILEIMNSYGNDFDFVNDNMEFLGVKANCFLDLAYQSFSIDDVSGGEAYLKKFEALCSQKKSVEPNTIFVEKAYSVAAGVYYKKGNYARSKQLLKTGLIYAPNNFGLKQRLSQM